MDGGLHYGKWKKEDINFRDLTYGLVLIVNDRNLPMLRNIFESRPRDNAILACGYIDHTPGISFEVLYLGEYGPNGEISLRRGNQTTSMKSRYDSVSGIILWKSFYFYGKIKKIF